MVVKRKHWARKVEATECQSSASTDCFPGACGWFSKQGQEGQHRAGMLSVTRFLWEFVLENEMADLKHCWQWKK